MAAQHFVGLADATLDGKNRVTLPSKFRLDGLGETLYLTALDSGVLYLYSEQEFNALRERVVRMLDGDGTDLAKAQQFLERLSGATERVTVDDNGRILIPTRHVEHAHLAKVVRMRGAFHRLELWEPTLLDARTAEATMPLDALATSIGVRL